MKKILKELREMSLEDAHLKTLTMRRDLFSSKLEAISARTFNSGEQRKMRRDIARALTILREKIEGI